MPYYFSHLKKSGKVDRRQAKREHWGTTAGRRKRDSPVKTGGIFLVRKRLK